MYKDFSGYTKAGPRLGAIQMVASPLRGVIANPEGEAIQSGHTLDCFVPRNDDRNPLNRVQFKWSHRHYGASLRTWRVKQSRAGTLDCFVPRNDDATIVPDKFKTLFHNPDYYPYLCHVFLVILYSIRNVY
jgi:hypothetical protein